jgi:hypothetical protein
VLAWKYACLSLRISKIEIDKVAIGWRS